MSTKQLQEHGARWTEQELWYVAEHMNKRSAVQIGDELGRSAGSVTGMIRTIKDTGIPAVPAHLTIDGLKYIEQNYKTTSDKKLGNKFGCDKKTIANTRVRFGWHRNTSHMLADDKNIQDYIKANYRFMSDKEMAEKLHVGVTTVADCRTKRLKLARVHYWTQEENDFLTEAWGCQNVQRIAAHLGRSTESIHAHAGFLGLGPYLDSAEDISFSRLVATIMGTDSQQTCNSHWYEKWVSRYGLPVKKRKTKNRTFFFVSLDQFWPWAEKNKDILDFSNFEPFSLGYEPDWVSGKRKSDYRHMAKNRFRLWSDADNRKFLDMLGSGKFIFSDFEREFSRSRNAIESHCRTLGTKLRPLRLDSGVIDWTPDKLSALTELIHNGESLGAICDKLGVCPHHCTHLFRKTYNTTSLTRIRTMMGSLPFGDKRTIRVADAISKSRYGADRETKQLIGHLVYSLKHELGETV